MKNPDWFSCPGVSKHPSLIPRLMSWEVSLFFLRYPWMFPMVNLSRESPVTHTQQFSPVKGSFTMESVLCNRNYNSQLIKAIQTRSQLSLVILISWPDLPRSRTGSEIWVRDYGDIGCDVSCLVGIARTQPGYEAESNLNFIVGKRI